MDTAAALPANDERPADGGSRRASRRAEQLEAERESALATLAAVSAHLETDGAGPAFFGALSESVAQLVRASRVAFWRFGARGVLSLQPDPFGFAAQSRIHGMRFHLDANRSGVIGRIALGPADATSSEPEAGLDAFWREHGLREVGNSIAAPWRAGNRRIGLVAAYDSRGGFMAHDAWLLRLAGLTAGLVWQYREAEDDLGQTAERLEEATAARRHLLNNIAAGGDEARRRFATALHDDSLQLLTGAELQLERIRADLSPLPQIVPLDQLSQTLHKVEDSLRRLLDNVSPEPLTIPGDLQAAISERLEQLRLRSGIEGDLESRLTDEIPPAIQGIAIKNVAEALTNVEKHARATRVTVVAEELDGGLRVEVTDDGTGFVVAESVRVPGHIGLVALRERALLAGGTCRISSEPGAGTTVEFWIPMSL